MDSLQHEKAAAMFDFDVTAGSATDFTQPMVSEHPLAERPSAGNDWSKTGDARPAPAVARRASGKATPSAARPKSAAPGRRPKVVEEVRGLKVAAPAVDPEADLGMPRSAWNRVTWLIGLASEGDLSAAGMIVDAAGEAFPIAETVALLLEQLQTTPGGRPYEEATARLERFYRAYHAAHGRWTMVGEFFPA
ncbi:MAG: hypothetical protein ACRC1K_09715 [Planctomycetia bacterium]